MKIKWKEIIYFLIVFVIFLSTLIFYLINKQKLFLILSIILGLFVLFLVNIYINLLKRKKFYNIAFNNIYYQYGENIVLDSKYIETKKLKNIKLKKLSIDGNIEYRLIDNQYVTQKIGLIKLDDIKTLIISYEKNYKGDYKGSLLNVWTEDYYKNQEFFINILGIPKINKENVYYSEDKRTAIVINKFNQYYQCITYFYCIHGGSLNLKNALKYSNPYWCINRDYCIKYFDTYKEAEQYVIKEMKIFNGEK